VDAPTAADLPVRVLIIPGLHDSGPAPWQTWLQGQYANAVRIEQDDWHAADLDRWAQRVRATVAAEPPARWIAVAHSFGCVALARYLKLGGESIASALLVAPADPKKFGEVDRLPLQPLSVRSTLIGSQSDPWMQSGRRACVGAAMGRALYRLGRCRSHQRRVRLRAISRGAPARRSNDCGAVAAAPFPIAGAARVFVRDLRPSKI
jgi:hypothetical protein